MTPLDWDLPKLSGISIISLPILDLDPLNAVFSWEDNSLLHNDVFFQISVSELLALCSKSFRTLRIQNASLSQKVHAYKQNFSLKIIIPFYSFMSQF